jgi:glycosyltransferase involved in cell wall biosynthesis|tara:strand:- start:3491 stop:4753 length:1263 start_codon:yes stop_codon:yes gene_type:complete
MVSLRNKVLLFVPTLAHGGAEKIVSLLSKNLSESEVSIAVLENRVSYPFKGNFYDLGIGYSKKHGFLGKVIKFGTGIKRIRQLKTKENFDVSISFIPICNILNIFSRKSEKVFLTVHVNEQMDQPKNFYGWLYMVFMKFCYRQAHRIIAVSRSLRTHIASIIGLDLEKTSVIYDPLDMKEIKQLSREPIISGLQSVFHNSVLINIGRLVPQKGHSHLVRVFRRIKDTCINTKLVILGEGDLLDELISLCHFLNLKVYAYNSDQTIGTDYDVYFLGFQKNPFCYLKASSLFVFPSLYEGFGIAIIESMFCGTPVIASDCDFGPREILSPMSPANFRTDSPETTDYGVLMPSFNREINGNTKLSNDQLEKVWAETILSLLTKSNGKKELFPKAAQRAAEFDINNLIVEWESLINGQNGARTL